MANDNMKYIAVVAIVAVFVVGLGAGMFINAGSNSSSSSQVYHLTLVITDSNHFNSTETQPAYFVLVDGQLQPSKDINVPLNKKIDLTIINYDDGADTVGAVYSNVTGTQNNQIMILSDDSLNAQNETNGIEISPHENVTTTFVPLDDISHTWTVLDANHNIMVNIPIEPSSTTNTFVTFTQKGDFHWACFVPCGDDAMGTAGWMEGTVTVA